MPIPQWLTRWLQQEDEALLYAPDGLTTSVPNTTTVQGSVTFNGRTIPLPAVAEPHTFYLCRFDPGVQVQQLVHDGTDLFLNGVRIVPTTCAPEEE